MSNEKMKKESENKMSKEKKKDWSHYKTQIKIRKNNFRIRKSMREPLWRKKIYLNF